MVRPVHGGCWWAIAALVVAPLLWVDPAGAETTIEVEAGYAARRPWVIDRVTR